jgi:hypothetical protein
MAGAAGAGVAIGMLGSAIGKGDVTACFTKRRGVLMSSTLKVLVQGFFRDYIMPGWNNRRRSRSSSQLFLDYLSLRK